MRLPPPHTPTEAWYRRRMASYRRGLAACWPVVFIALGAAIAIGLISPDRSQPNGGAAPASAENAR
ncbi:hypothetical protein [Phenylobacterium sp.]|uniref:hypothetical protein n=1 Tax=Phenylobacterium sp. TaxID=1871053 RepID=UPI00374C9EC3